MWPNGADLCPECSDLGRTASRRCDCPATARAGCDWLASSVQRSFISDEVACLRGVFQGVRRRLRGSASRRARSAASSSHFSHEPVVVVDQPFDRFAGQRLGVSSALWRDAREAWKSAAPSQPRESVSFLTLQWTVLDDGVGEHTRALGVEATAPLSFTRRCRLSDLHDRHVLIRTDTRHGPVRGWPHASATSALEGNPDSRALVAVAGADRRTCCAEPVGRSRTDRQRQPEADCWRAGWHGRHPRARSHSHEDGCVCRIPPAQAHDAAARSSVPATTSGLLESVAGDEAARGTTRWWRDG